MSLSLFIIPIKQNRESLAFSLGNKIAQRRHSQLFLGITG